MRALTAALMAGLAAYRGHRAEAAASVEARLAQLERRVAYAEELIDEGHIRLVALEHPPAPSNPAATCRYGWQPAAIVLALLVAVPAFAKDAPLPVLPEKSIPAVPVQPRWVAPVDTDTDADAKLYGPASCVVDGQRYAVGAEAHGMTCARDRSTTAWVPTQTELQRQEVDLLRQIEADLAIMLLRQQAASK
ncbi:MAG: hypothetical protein ABSC06_35425 [Rhodopila sp.]